ncbi:SRPBCC family protein [Ilumatobacter sp.]|uniref:SRPBCC family protein n=1 Tax=Ilumatobacter sp. TaxID=1967498 RepID=UPI003AF43AE2
MRSVHVSRQMSAPRSAVWSVLADFPNIATWNGGVKASHATSEATSGVGAQRHCDLAPVGTLEETIAEWVDGERMVVSIDSATKLPIERGAATFTLGDDTTTIDYEFEPKGFVGRLTAPLLVRQLTKGFGGFLADLDTAAADAAAASS